MNTSPDLSEFPGNTIQSFGLQIPKAKQFARYLELSGRECFAKLIECRSKDNHATEIVFFSIQVERPQLLAHDIRREEVLAVTFEINDITAPMIYSLRRDFPSVPHLNLTDTEFPKCICIYDLPYDQVRPIWTPANFLQRIHYWFSATAKGSLHGKDQPLEPLLMTSNHRLILPSDFDPNKAVDAPVPVLLYQNNLSEDECTLRAVQPQSSNYKGKKCAIAVVLCEPQVHGIINRIPANIFELHLICKNGGIDLTEKIETIIRQWMCAKENAGCLDYAVVLLVYLPKKRERNGVVETYEKRAFLVGSTIEQLGMILGVIDKHKKHVGFIIGGVRTAPEALKCVPIFMMQVLEPLTQEVAALMNGSTPSDDLIVGIGMGAIGSHVFNNLIRSGYGRWTLIDDDTHLPHNSARHILGDWAVGAKKAMALAEYGKATMGDTLLANGIPANVINPGKYKAETEAALEGAKLVLDMSASIAVSRYLASLKSFSRYVSIFAAPKGDGLIITAEDDKRTTRLDWLEMMHYRAVIHVSELANSLQSTDSRFRYGNSCRDISTQLAHDNIVMWAGLASKAAKLIQADSRATISIYSTTATGDIKLIKKVVHAPRVIKGLDNWEFHIDQFVINKISKIRLKKLPNETGGILLGSFDTHRCICFIIDVLPSPNDSEEWPTSYIRGSEGLTKCVMAVQDKTLGQVGYVGEWHSHPDGAAISPSNDDLKAYAWLSNHMGKESLPAVMLIAGDHKSIRFVFPDTI